MSLDVVRYQHTREAVVHRRECHVWTTSARIMQITPVVTVDEGWVVRTCSLCRPVYGVVVRERWRVVSRGLEMVRRFETREVRRRLRANDVDVPPWAVEHAGWKQQAACRSHDERLNGWLRWLFLTETGQRWQIDVQKHVCQSCPVRGDCLIAGVWGEEPFGVWGGATVGERKVLLKKWRRGGRQDARLPSSQGVVVSVG
jgi:WhiB family transcriptional regulator, redox-sensing transcriptional regulator